MSLNHPAVEHQTTECLGFLDPTTTLLIKSDEMMMNYNVADTDINLTCGPTMLCPGLAWPRHAIPQECQLRGNNPTWYPLRPPEAAICYVCSLLLFLPTSSPSSSLLSPNQLSSCADVNTLSQLTLTLPNICFSLSVLSWVRVWRGSVHAPSPPSSFSVTVPVK